jgi:23S rRNA (cytosine1962-C5)-methyltransferase
VILDPPTFSRSKTEGVFQVEKDYPRLVQLALPLLVKNGVLLASTNAASVKPEKFLVMLQEIVGASRRAILQHHYAPQPPDFRVTREEPAYLKTVWCRIV